MTSTISDKSSVTRKDISTLYAAIFNKLVDNAVMGVFAESFKIVPRKTRDILATKDQIDRIDVGYSTNAYLCFEWLLQEKIKVDRIFLLSDMQCWDSRHLGQYTVARPFIEWQRAVSPDAYSYSIDLAGYGTMQFPKDAKNVVTLAGYSEKVFEFASSYEADRRTMLAAIEAKTPRAD